MNQRSATTSMGRRAFLAGAAGTAAAGTVPAGVTAQEDPFDGYLDDARNYDGEITDATGEDEVQVVVGGGDNNLSFDPAAIRIDPGTTVVWEWTGEGGEHDVTARDESFQSELTDEEGATFEHAFEEESVTSYYCTPHEAAGMKGGVVVGDPDVGSDGGLQSIPLLPGVGIALAIIAITSAAVGRWVGRGRDATRM